MKKILFSFLLIHLSSTPSSILYTDIPESLKNLLQDTQKETEYQVNKSLDYVLEISTYAPHITLAYLSKEKMSLKQLYESEPLLKAKLIALANRTAPINMDKSIQHLEIELWPLPFPSTHMGKTYNKGVIIVIRLPVPQALHAFTQAIDKELDELSTISKRKFPFKAHATIGWLYHKDDIDPSAMGEKIKEVLQPYIDRFNTLNEQYTIDSFVLAAGNQKKKFILQKFKTSTAFQPDRSRPCARPAQPGCSYCPTRYTPAQSACPRSR